MFRFLTCSDHFAFRAETDQEREVLSLSWISPRFFKHALSLERWTCSVTSAVAQNPAAARFPLSVLKPQVFRPLRSAGFFDRAISPFFAKGLVFVFTYDLSG
ncbi:MAG: hypothetical protein ACFWUG_00125 [Rahnella inusitata]|jgi:hypothetical protein